MKSLNYFELKSLLSWLEPQLMGAQLQEIWTNGEQLVLELYLKRSQFLVLDLRPQAPSLWLSYLKPPIAKKSKPVSLFLNSHAKNLRLTEIFASAEKGRVVDLWFESKEKTCHCEIILIPRMANLLVESNGKKISWEKPRELAPAQLPAETSIDIDWQEWCENKYAQLTAVKNKKDNTEINAEKILEKAIQKKKKAVIALKESLNSDEHMRWQALGEHLKSSQEVPLQWNDLYDRKISVKDNREKAFQKAKDLVRKQEGTARRLQELEAEIEKLSTEGLPLQQSTSNKLLKKTDSKARKLILAEGIEALIGKSAADNLSILRQARAWDLWMHLKDYPGAHAIIFRQKNQNVTPGQIREVAEWVISESRKISMGAKYDVVVVECRHVRPIKGDKLGRVTYHYPTTYTFGS